MPEILASIDDVNANLPASDDTPVVVATDENSSLVQISVVRIVRGYLSRAFDNSILMSWRAPDTTPEIIREIAAKLIASQVFYNKTAEASPQIAENSVSQRLYDEGISMLQQIIAGDIIIDGLSITATQLSDLDYWPNSDTDRAFTMGQQF